MPFMKQLTNYLLAFFIVTIVFLVIPASGFAQVIDPSCDPLDPKCPIDGGLTALLAIGVGYGIKKVRDSRKA